MCSLLTGEILTFDNIRVFHGRSTYEGDRHLEGGYLDWDYVYSKIRVLRKTNKQESWQSRLIAYKDLQASYEWKVDFATNFSF